MSKRQRLAKLEQARESARLDLTITIIPAEEATVTGFELDGHIYHRHEGEALLEMEARLQKMVGGSGIHIAAYLTE